MQFMFVQLINMTPRFAINVDYGTAKTRNDPRNVCQRQANVDMQRMSSSNRLESNPTSQ